MTKHESFKRRVRERMEKTGERYGAARRVLLGGLSPDTDIGVTSGVTGRRVRVSEPEVDDASILRATGRTGTSGAT